MGDLLVECPIHLDVVSVNDLLILKCGHGFCKQCLEQLCAHHHRCPMCRQPTKREEAVPLFVTFAPLSTGAQSASQRAAEAAHTRLIRELEEAKAAHICCLDRFVELQGEIVTLKQDGAHQQQMIGDLRGRYELLEGQLATETDNSVRAKEECSQMKEEATKLRGECLETSRALEQALKEVQVQLERVKELQSHIEQHKDECSLEKKQRVTEDASSCLLMTDDDSWTVVDGDVLDMPHRPGLGSLDETCEVRDAPGDEDSGSEKANEDEREVQLSGADIKGKRREDEIPGPLFALLRARIPDWKPWANCLLVFPGSEGMEVARLSEATPFA